MSKVKQTKARMSDDSMLINLEAHVFSGKEGGGMARIHIKFKALLVTKGCTEVIQTNFQSKLPNTVDEELDNNTKLGKVKK